MPNQSQDEIRRKLRDRNPGCPPDFGIAFGGSGGEREGQMPRPVRMILASALVQAENRPTE
jgi:hypothetical protein